MNPLQPINPDNVQPWIVDPDHQGWRLCVEAEREHAPSDVQFLVGRTGWITRGGSSSSLRSGTTYRTRAPLPVIAPAPTDHGCADEFIERPSGPAMDAPAPVMNLRLRTDAERADYLQGEVHRLLSENLILKSGLEKSREETKQARAHAGKYMTKLQDLQILVDQFGYDVQKLRSQP